MLPESRRLNADEVLGDQAILLGVPQECAHPTAAAQSLLHKAVVDALNPRAFILDQAVTLAAGCDCVKPLQNSNKECRNTYLGNTASLSRGRGWHEGG